MKKYTFDLKKISKEMAERLGLRLVILFGSRVSGKVREDSDYDVAVFTTETKNIKKNLGDYSEMLNFLSKELNIPEDKLDLTNLNNANPFLAYEVLFRGQLLFGSVDDFAELKARAYRYYIDAKQLFDFEKKMADKRHKLTTNTLNSQFL